VERDLACAAVAAALTGGHRRLIEVVGRLAEGLATADTSSL